PGAFWIGGFEGWRARAYAPASGTGGQWKRISVTYTTGPDETEARVMINTDSPTKGVWIDDYKVEEGSEPTPFVLEEGAAEPRIEASLQGRTADGQVVNPWMPDRYPPTKYVFGDQLWLTGYALNAAGRKLIATVSSEGKVVEQREAIVPETNCAQFEFGLYLQGGGNLHVEAAIEGACRTSYDVTVITPAQIRSGLQQLRPLIEALGRKVEAMGPRGHYPRVTLTIARHFANWIEEDVRHAELARAWAQLQSVREMVERALNRADWPEAPKFVTSRVDIDGPAFVADVLWPDGRRQRRPVIFVGQGPFGQARRDAHILPDYGFNIMQVEFGPNSVLPEEGKFSDAAIAEFLELCDRAARAGVQVNLLISPHYFPDWALQKWPHLNECSGGFFRYCVHAPEAREILRQFIEYTIPRIKDHPALHSICLSTPGVAMARQGIVEDVYNQVGVTVRQRVV
ncbi:MAG: hypothetical protein H5T86_16055, partial [Armatimonadetes bacterium]|nr:hypothetical protein [Armatimonadota bacterium]